MISAVSSKPVVSVSKQTKDNFSKGDSLQFLQLPAVEIFLLFCSETVNRNIQRLQFDLGYTLINFFGHRVHSMG